MFFYLFFSILSKSPSNLLALEYYELTNGKAVGNLDDVNYLNANRVPTNRFTATTLSDQNGHGISNAFDSSDKTFWASSTVNTDTVKSSITFEFKSSTTLDAIVLHPAFSTKTDVTPNTRRYDGFPTKMKVYTKYKNEEFKLHTIFTGTPLNTNVWDRFQFVFQRQITCDQLKIEFTEVTQDVSFGNDYTAACAELYLVQPPYDELSNTKARGDYNNISYLNAHRVPKNKLTATTLGDQSGKGINNAFDSNNLTFWASSTVNSATTKNTITIEFTSQTKLDAIVMMPAYSTNNNVDPTTRRYDGFPTTMKVYTKLNNEDFRLHSVFTGTPSSTDIWNLVQFEFKHQITCDQIKIEFTEVTRDISFGEDFTAACGELYLVQPPTPVTDELENAQETGDLGDVSYLNAHRVSTDNFKVSTLGDQNGHGILNAFDSSTTSFWASSTVNTDTVKNTITFEFKSSMELDAIVMMPAYSTKTDVNPNTRRYDGFPTTMKVYTASNNKEFELHSIFTGTPEPTDIWDRVQFVFKRKVICDRLKIEFTEVTIDVSFGNDYTAACGELYLVQSVPVFDELFNGRAAGDYDDVNYLDKNRVPITRFKAKTLGDQNGHGISNAFDSSDTAFWASSTVNTDTVKNTITFEFQYLTTLDAIVMMPAYSTKTDVNPNTRRYDGFPTTMKVYTAMNNDEFELHTVFTGTPASTNIWDRFQFVFERQIKCDRLKIEFTEVTLDVSFGNDYTAACGELYLLQPPISFDELTNGKAAGDYDNVNYLEAHRVKSSDVRMATLGDQSSHEIDKAFDSNSNTFWASSFVNTQTVKNSIIIQFKTTTTIDAIVLHPAYSTNTSVNPNTRRYDGFPTTMKVYTAFNNEEFNLHTVFTGTPAPTDVWDRVQFVFRSQISFDRLKIEFTDVTRDVSFGNDFTASCAELYLVRPSNLTFTNENFIPGDNPSNRIEKIIKDDSKIYVNVKVTVTLTTISTKVNNDGGAIHIENCGLDCTTTTFNNCKSPEGAGGGIYVKNKDEHNAVNLVGLTFNECQAKFGGAVYVYSNSTESSVIIKKCIFSGNKATASDSDESQLYGGSAVFLAVQKGMMIRNTFRDNSGDGGSVKIYNSFEQDDTKTKSMKLLNDNILLISDCSFEINKNSDCCLFYLRGNNGALVKLQKCSFNGSLIDGSRYIDGKTIDKKGSKLLVNKCKFSQGSANSIKLKDYLSIDLNDQIFARDENIANMKNKLSLTTWIIIAAVCAIIALIAVSALVIVMVIIKRKNNNDIDENEMPDEVCNSLISETSTNI